MLTDATGPARVARINRNHRNTHLVRFVAEKALQLLKSPIAVSRPLRLLNRYPRSVDLIQFHGSYVGSVIRAISADSVDCPWRCEASKYNFVPRTSRTLRKSHETGSSSNSFIERLWRSVKYEHVYLNEYGSPREARIGLRQYLTHYNAAPSAFVVGLSDPRSGLHRERIVSLLSVYRAAPHEWRWGSLATVKRFCRFGRIGRTDNWPIVCA